MPKNFTTGKNALIIRLCGEIDQYAAAELKSSIDIEIENSSKKNLIFDLGDVELMDSSGIGLVMGRYKLMKNLSGTVVIENAPNAIKKVMRMAGIEKLISGKRGNEVLL